MKVIDNNLTDNIENSSVDDDDSFLNDLDFIKLLIVAKKNLLWVTLIVSIGLAAAYTYNRYSQPVFESASVIKLDIKTDASILGISSNGKEQTNTANLSGEIELIQSRLIHERAVSLLPIDVTYFADGNINSKELYRSSPFRVSYEIKNPEFYDKKFKVQALGNNEFNLYYELNGEKVEKKYHFGQAIETNDFKIILFLNQFTNKLDGNFSFIINSKESLVNYISSNLVVSVLNPTANTIQISFKDHEGSKSKDVVKAIDSVYLIESLQRKFQAQEQTIKFLDDQLAITDRNLSEYETKLENFTIKNKTASITEEVGKVIGNSEFLKAKLAELRIQMSVLDELKDLMLKNETLKKHLPTLSALPDPQITEGILRLNKLQQDKEKLLSTTKATTFAAKNKDIEIENVKNNLFELILQNKKILYEAIVEHNNKIVEEENKFYSLPSKETELTRLKRFYSLYEKYYLMMIDRYLHLRLFHLIHFD